MAERSPKPDNAPRLAPYLVVTDAQASMDFYERVFGFAKTDEVIRDGEGRPVHVGMRFKEASVMFAPEGIRGSRERSPATSSVGSPVAFYVYCDDVDAFHKRAVEAGAKSEQAPQDMFWGDRVCTLLDRDGYKWSFATNVADFDPAKVPG